VADRRVEACRGELAEPDATIDTDPATLIALLHGRRTLPEAQSAGDATIIGDQPVVARFLGLFPLARARGRRRLSRPRATPRRRRPARRR